MSASDATQAFLNQYQDKLNSVGPSAVWIQLGLMSAISLVALLGFSLLRPANAIVYQPKLKYAADGKAPPRIARGLLDWVKPLAQTTEDTLMQTIGLDAVCFLRFLKMCRDMFCVIALVASVILFPIDIVYNVRNVPTRNFFSMLTIQSVDGPDLYAHVAITYAITLIVFYFVWVNYSRMIALRWQYFRSDEYQNSLHARSLLITQVGKASHSDQGLSALLSSLSIPYPTTSVHIGRKVGILPELLQQHNDAVRALEVVLTRYFKNEKPGKPRPTMKADGQKVDAIDYLTTKVQGLAEKIDITRKNVDAEQPENYGFASFACVPYAHIVAKTLQDKRKAGSYFQLAPLPLDIIWKNLTMTDASRASSKILGGVILVAVATLYTIPLLAVAVLANMAAFTTFLPWLESLSTSQPFWFSAFAGVVPPLLSVLLQLLLPMIMRAIATFQGDTTHSQSDRVVTARYSAFLFITQFFIFSVLAVIISLVIKIAAEIGGQESFATIMKNLQSVPRSLQTTWVIQSMYWLTVFPLRGFSFAFDLAQVVTLLLVWVQTILFGRTPRDIREFSKPPVFDFAVYFSNHLLMVAVGLVYAPLAPLVALFAAIAFAMSFIVYKYQLMYVSATRVETGGRLWRVAINRILFAVGGMQALMLLTVGVQLGWLYSTCMLPAIVGVVVFKLLLSRKFNNLFQWYIPNDQEMSELHFHKSDEREHRLESRFGHPSLHEPVFSVMLHKSIQHLLPTVFKGHLHTSKKIHDKEGGVGASIGGINFRMMEGQEDMLDREGFKRETDDDTTSMITAPPAFSRAGTMDASSTMTGGDYFDNRRKEYAGDNESPYELSQLNQQNYSNAAAYASTEHLIDNAGYSDRKQPVQPSLGGRQYSSASGAQSFDFGFVGQESAVPDYSSQQASTYNSQYQDPSTADQQQYTSPPAQYNSYAHDNPAPSTRHERGPSRQLSYAHEQGQSQTNLVQRDPFDDRQQQQQQHYPAGMGGGVNSASRSRNQSGSDDRQYQTRQ